YLGAQAVEKNGGGENNSLCLPQCIIDFAHVVGMYAKACFYAATAVLARLDLHDVELENAYLVSCFPQGLECTFQKKFGVPAGTRAAVECYDFHQRKPFAVHPPLRGVNSKGRKRSVRL